MAKTSPARKARLKERRRVSADEERQKADLHRRAGHRCSNCHHGDKPFSMIGATVCQLDSDWEGYAAVKPEFVCSRFKPEIV